MVTRIVKIGGASITDKSQFEHVKLANINFIVDLFKNNHKNLILVHGAGSFGYVEIFNKEEKQIYSIYFHSVIIKLNSTD